MSKKQRTATAVDNAEYVRLFTEIADLLELQEANPFRVRAYRNAAHTIESLGQELAVLAGEGVKRVTQLPGIGDDLAGKIVEISERGSLTFLDELRAAVPSSLLGILRISGMGPKRTRKLWKEQGIDSIEKLEVAARAGKLKKIAGFGPTLEEKILAGVALARARADRFKIADVDACATALLRHLKKAKGVKAIEAAGSYRRRRETIGDLDILIAAAPAAVAGIAERLTSYADVDEILAKGDTKVSVRLKTGLQVDLRMVEPRSWGAALHYFTGSKAHNVTIRGIARERGMKVNEYGIFRGDRRIAGKTEGEIYAAVDLPWIPPEIREGEGELEAARDGKLPVLIERRHIRGDLQMHSRYSDGQGTIREMAEACRALKYEYLAITDHSPAVRVARGVSPADLRLQFAEIDGLRKELDGIHIFKSAEVDILPDGSLDYDDDLLAAMDIVLVSIHTSLQMTKKEMTARIVKALQHPRVHILGHPTGRRIQEREAYAIDMEEIMRVAREEGVILELNAQPHRLDLRDTYLRMAKEAGVKIVISTDAHRPSDLDFMRYGIDQARRGWLEKSDVVNTLPLAKLVKVLRK